MHTKGADKMIALKRLLELETLFLVTVTAAISSFYVLNKTNHQSSNISLKMPVSVNYSSNSLIPTDSAPKTFTSSQISPDGTKKVIMEKTVNENSAQAYTFYTSDDSGENKNLIFTKTLDVTKSMSVPFNTWSPDNKYFFIQEIAKEENNVLVFNALGTPFPNQEKYLNTAADKATGWASETLIIFNTKKSDNTKGSSYWFEVPTEAIIPLSEDF